MKKLSEFTEDKAFAVIADLMEPIVEILKVPENREIQGKTRFSMFAGFLKNSPDAMRKIFAILSEEDPETFRCSAAQIARYTMQLISDDDFISLFT